MVAPRTAVQHAPPCGCGGWEVGGEGGGGGSPLPPVVVGGGFGGATGSMVYDINIIFCIWHHWVRNCVTLGIPGEPVNALPDCGGKL